MNRLRVELAGITPHLVVVHHVLAARRKTLPDAEVLQVPTIAGSASGTIIGVAAAEGGGRRRRRR